MRCAPSSMGAVMLPSNALKMGASATWGALSFTSRRWMSIVAVEVRGGVPRSAASTTSETLSCCSRSNGANTVSMPLLSPIANRFAPDTTNE